MKKNTIINKKICGIIVLAAVAAGLCLGTLTCKREKAEIKANELERHTEEKINYTVDMVKDEKESVVIKQYAMLYGEDSWNRFLEDAENNKESHICIYFTDNEYSVNNYIDLTYDGSYFIVKKYKRDEEEKYKYIYGFDYAEKTGKMFVLMNKEGITYEEYESKTASSLALPDDGWESCILFLVEK